MKKRLVQSEGIISVMRTKGLILLCLTSLFIILGYAVGYESALEKSSKKCIKLVDEVIKEIKSGQ